MRVPLDVTLLEPSIHIGDKAREHLQRVWRDVAAPRDAEAIRRLSGLCSGFLPGELAEAVDSFATRGNEHGALLIRNFPFDALDGALKRTAYAEAALLGVSSFLGRPFGNVGQRNGAILQHLRPVREDAAKQLGTGSCELLWHTEDAHSLDNGSFILLFCLRGEPTALSLVSRVIPEELDPDTRTLLMEPGYAIDPDESYTHSTPGIAATPVLSTRDGRVDVRFEPIYVRCASEAHHAALQRLTDHINARAAAVSLTAGDLLVIDNREAVHARTAFAPRFDGTDRWLLRTVV